MIMFCFPDGKGEKNNKFRKLYDKYVGFVYYTARQFTGEQSEAEDIVQETFLKIFNKMDIIRTDTEYETTAFIYKITRYSSIDYLRKKSNTVFLDDLQREEEIAIDSTMVDVIYIKDIMKIINTMDDMYSVPLQLKIDGYKIDEIADLLGITKENVKIRIHRARKMIKDRLEEK